MSDLLTVELGPRATNIPGKPGATLIFHEEHDAHPAIGGDGRHEALVVSGRTVKVGDTQRVRDAIARGILMRVDDRKAETPVVQVADVIDQDVDAIAAAKAEAQAQARAKK